MIVLGIESTAHTFGVGIVKDEKPYILADARAEYVPREGIHPREAARFFAEHAASVINKALKQANVDFKDIDGIAIALGPGMGPCLRIGATIARFLASYYDKKLIPVNHAVAHVEIGLLVTKATDPVVVYLSGGNTAIVAYVDGRYRVFGETLDIALGNLLDTFAREVGLAPPYIVGSLHVVDKCAEDGKKFINLPYVVKGQDVSFSGLLTAALRAVRKGTKLNDVCLTLREIAYTMVVEVAERALAHTGKNEVMLVGGVAASPILREKFEKMVRYHNAKLYVVPPKFAVDNGVMIAWTGLLGLKHGVSVNIENSIIRQRWRIDEVDITWRA
ncbi:MAG: UGMP family protein [Thermoprotei archaeon]|nr:MAG: UGMP family protein [Thermoprotei archaeon]